MVGRLRVATKCLSSLVMLVEWLKTPCGPTTKLDLLWQMAVWLMEPPTLLVVVLMKRAKSRSWLN